MGWSGITISSDEEEIVTDLQGNTKMIKLGEEVRKGGSSSSTA
jgi:hypothetical protein